MLTYRILISDFDSELRSVDVQWMGRQFRWGETLGPKLEVLAVSIPYAMKDYLLALADNTRKPLVACMALAAKHAFPDASIEVMTPEDIAQADAIKY